MTDYDQNHNPVHRNVERGPEGWGVTVYFGSSQWGGVVTNVRRYYYETRQQARDGDIGDDIGQRGRVA